MNKLKWIRDIKGIGWDLDGTLYPANTIPEELFIETQVKAVMEKNNWSKKKAKEEYEEIYKEIGSHTKTLSKLGVNGVSLFLKFWDELPLEKYLKPDKKLIQMFKLLKGVRHFVLSNGGREEQVKRKMKLLGLDLGGFEMIVSGYDLGLVKPSKEIFQGMAKKMNLKTSEIMYVGDREKADVIGAKEAGMRTCLVYGESKEADVSLESVYEVAEMFGKKV